MINDKKFIQLKKMGIFQLKLTRTLRLIHAVLVGIALWILHLWTGGWSVELAEAAPQTTVVSSCVVDAAGADIAAGQTGSPIDGMVVHIPPGALEFPDRISLGYSTKSVHIRSGGGSGVVVVLQAQTLKWFKKSVSIEVHFRATPRPTIVIPYRIDAKGGLHSVQLSRLDLDQSTFWFDTFSPGEFTWVYLFS